MDEVPVYYSTPEIRFDCADDIEKNRIMEQSYDYFSKMYQFSDIDGIRLELEDGWALIRCSNTQPVIVCRIEAISNEKLTIYKSMIIDKLISLGVKTDG